MFIKDFESFDGVVIKLFMNGHVGDKFFESLAFTASVMHGAEDDARVLIGFIEGVIYMSLDFFVGWVVGKD